MVRTVTNTLLEEEEPPEARSETAALEQKAQQDPCVTPVEAEEEDLRHIAEPPESLWSINDFLRRESAYYVCDLERLMRARDYARRPHDDRHRAPREEVIAYNSLMHWEIVRDDDSVAEKLDIAITALELLRINIQPTQQALILLSDAIGWDDWKKLPRS